MTRRLSFRIGLCAALVSGLLFAGSGTALADCETVWVDLYDIRLGIDRDTYRIGDTVKVHATVTRKDTGTPVEGATFVAAAWNTRKGMTFGYEETDATGRATARLKLEKGSVKPGPVRLRSIAYEKTEDPTTCVQVYEYGEKRLRNAFTVKP